MPSDDLRSIHKLVHTILAPFAVHLLYTRSTLGLIHTHTHTHTHTRICTQTRIHTHKGTHAQTHKMHTYTHKYTLTNTHTRTHTYIQILRAKKGSSGLVVRESGSDVQERNRTEKGGEPRQNTPSMAHEEETHTFASAARVHTVFIPNRIPRQHTHILTHTHTNWHRHTHATHTHCPCRRMRVE